MDLARDHADHEKKISKVLLRKTYVVTIIMLLIGQIQVLVVMEM